MSPHARGATAPPHAPGRAAPPFRRLLHLLHLLHLPRLPRLLRPLRSALPGFSSPSPAFPARLAAARSALAWVAGFLLSGAFLGACSGGTSTDAGNPELVIGFRQDGKPVDLDGIVRIYAADSNPVFYSPSPPGNRSSQDGKVDVEIYPVGWKIFGPNWIPLKGATGPVLRIDRFFLEEAAGYRPALPLLPQHQYSQYDGLIAAQPGMRGLAAHRPFNILADLDGSTTALVGGIAINAERDGYLAADGSAIDTLWVDLRRSVDISGTIDTAGLPDKPLILYLPGTPLSSPVQGNRFHLEDAPRIKFPVRMVTRSGLIYAFKELLDGTRSDAFYADSVVDLAPGDRLDSVHLPDVLPFPAAPVARPAGPRTFTDSLWVTLSAEDGAVIHYTLGGEEPSLQSPRYQGPVRIQGTAILKAVAYRQGQNLSPVSANNYLLVPLPPKASPASQAFRDSVIVTLGTTVMNGIILFTVDGTAPHDSSPVYQGPLVFRSTTTLKAVTSVEGLGLSPVLEERYILIPDTLGQP